MSKNKIRLYILSHYHQTAKEESAKIAHQVNNAESCLTSLRASFFSLMIRQIPVKRSLCYREAANCNFTPLVRLQRYFEYLGLLSRKVDS